MRYSVLGHITIKFYFLFLLMSTCHLAGQSTTPSSFYKIIIEEENIDEVQIEWTFTLRDSLLFMATGAEQFPNRWGKFVENLKVQDQTGKGIEIASLSDAHWRLHTHLDQKIKVSYKIKLEHEDYEWSGGIDGIAYLKAWGIFCSGRSLFLMNDTQNAHEVNFEIPNNWKVSSSWPTNIQKHSFKVRNNHSLANAMFFAGIHEELVIKREGFELIFALGGSSIIAQKEEFRNLAEGILGYYISLYGGIPIPPPDQVLEKAVVIINPGEATDGEVVGNDISILLDVDGEAMSQMISRFIFAHEFFHLWNGKTFAPEQDDVEWFKEGFTNYYTLKSLYKVGVLDQQSYFDMIGQFFYTRYKNDDGVGHMTMTDGALKHNHWGLIYAGGLFVALIQDIQIRQASKNQKSIDDLMRQLYRKHGGTNTSYTIEDLEEGLSALNGSSQKAFFQNYIIGTQKLPLMDCLNQIGLNAKIEHDHLIIDLPEDIPTDQLKIITGLLGS